MRIFRYRLRSALNRAKRAEQVLQIEVARLEEELKRTREQMESLRQQGMALQVRFRALHSEDLDIHRVMALGRDLERVQDLLEELETMHRQLGKRVEATRKRLVEAARARRVLEKHREVLAERHRRAELAAEIKHLDDLASTRFAARRPAGGTS